MYVSAWLEASCGRVGSDSQERANEAVTSLGCHVYRDIDNRVCPKSNAYQPASNDATADAGRSVNVQAPAPTAWLSQKPDVAKCSAGSGWEHMPIRITRLAHHEISCKAIHLSIGR